MAPARIVDEPVLQPVDCVARVDGCFRDERQLRGRNDWRAVFVVRRDPRREESERLPNAVVRRIAGDDPVVVFGKALRFGQRFVPAARAAVEVRVLGKSTGMIADDQSGGFSRHMQRAPRPVDQLFRMTLRELHVVARVAGVGARRRIAATQSGGHGGVGNRPGIAAVADPFELAVPRVGRRNPHFEFDLGIGGRPRRRFNATERGQLKLQPRRAAAGRREHARGHRRRGSNRDVGDRQRGKIRARGAVGCGGRHENTDERRNRDRENQRSKTHHNLLGPWPRQF